MEKREIEFWDQDDVEQLSHSEQDEAIEYILDGLDELPETLEICGYARMEVKESADNLAERVLEDLIENLDDEYGGEEPTEISEKMKNKSKEFVQFILDVYESWQCEIVKRETIKVDDWVKENRPDWLEK